MVAQSKQTWFGRYFGSRLFLVIALVVAVFVAFGYARAYYQDYKIRQEIATLEREVQALETRKIESLGILEYVTSDNFVEDTARTELGMRKPGEHVIVMKRDQYEQSSYIEDAESSQHLNNPVKWWYYFTHK